MNFQQPQLLLLVNDNEEYILHSTTYFPKINILAHGYSVAESLNEENELIVELYAIEDNSLPNEIIGINPVVHITNLGTPFGDDGIEGLDASIEVGVYIVEANNPQIRRKAGSSTVKQPSTSSVTKPVVPR